MSNNEKEQKKYCKTQFPTTEIPISYNGNSKITNGNTYFLYRKLDKVKYSTIKHSIVQESIL